MAIHVTNLRSLILGTTDAPAATEETRRDAHLEQLWAAHRVMATGTKGPHSFVVPAPLSAAEHRQRVEAAPRVGRPVRAAS